MSQRKKIRFNKTKKLKSKLNDEIEKLINDTTKDITDVGADDRERRELNKRIKAFGNIRNAINSGEAKSRAELQKIFDDGLYTVLQWRALRKENRTLKRYKKMIKKNMKEHKKVNIKLNNLPPSGQDSKKKNLLENKGKIERTILRNKSLEQEQVRNIIELQKKLDDMVTKYIVSPREDFLVTTSATSDDGFSSSEESMSSPRKAPATTRKSPREPSPRRNDSKKRKQPDEAPIEAYKRQELEKKPKATRPTRRVRIPIKFDDLPKSKNPVPFKGPLKPTSIFRSKGPKPPKPPKPPKTLESQHDLTVAQQPPPYPFADVHFPDVEFADVEDNTSPPTSSIRVTRKKLPSFDGITTIHVKPRKKPRATKRVKMKTQPELVTSGIEKIMVQPGPNSNSGNIRKKKERKKKERNKGGRRTRKRLK